MFALSFDSRKGTVYGREQKHETRVKRLQQRIKRLTEGNANASEDLVFEKR